MLSNVKGLEVDNPDGLSQRMENEEKQFKDNLKPPLNVPELGQTKTWKQ